MELAEARNHYKYIVAWCQMIHGDSTYFVDQYLKEAIKYNAPEDAVFRCKDGTWTLFKDVTNHQTLLYMDRILNPDKVRTVESHMTPLMPGVTSHRKYILCEDTGTKYKNIKEAAIYTGCTPDYLGDCIRAGVKCKGKMFRKVVE